MYFKNVQLFVILTIGIQHFQILLGNQCLFLKTLFISDFQFQPVISRRDKIFPPRLEQLILTSSKVKTVKQILFLETPKLIYLDLSYYHDSDN